MLVPLRIKDTKIYENIRTDNLQLLKVFLKAKMKEGIEYEIRPPQEIRLTEQAKDDNINVIYSRLTEDLFLTDFLNDNAVSAKVLDTENARELEYNDLLSTISLVEVQTSGKDLLLIFNAQATKGYPAHHKYRKTKPSQNWNLEANPAELYTLKILFQGILKTIDRDSSPEDIEYNMTLYPMKLYSNDPSFNYQGFAYNLSRQDASLIRQTIKPEKWDKVHGSTYLTKHFVQLFKYWEKYLSDWLPIIKKSL
jgi:hypothetical protein